MPANVPGFEAFRHRRAVRPAPSAREHPLERANEAALLRPVREGEHLLVKRGPVDANNHVRLSHQPPRGGFLCTGRLAAGLRGDPESADLRARTARLNAMLDAQPTQGAFFGDLTKGGRPATPDELRSLRGFPPDGTPRGLQRCRRCGDWAGTCLDASEVFAGLVMTVHCRCDNHNRCARCGDLLAERRLNANFYDPGDRSIWHVPGFEAFGHQCAR